MLPVVDSTSVSHMIMDLLYKNSPYTVNDICPFPDTARLHKNQKRDITWRMSASTKRSRFTENRLTCHTQYDYMSISCTSPKDTGPPIKMLRSSLSSHSTVAAIAIAPPGC